MSEENNVVTPVEGDSAGDAVDYKAKYEEALEHSRKWEGFAKKDKDDAENWRKHQDSLRSREEQAELATKAAEARAVQAEAQLLRSDLARKHGITDEFFELLTATEPDALEAQAVKVAALIAQKKSEDPFPKADPSQGARGAGPASNADMFADLLANKL